MTYREIAGVGALPEHPLVPAWTSCELGLEHAVSGDHYWLDVRLTFRAGGERHTVWRLGPCAEDAPERILAHLAGHGFARKGRRFIREWEYHDLAR